MAHPYTTLARLQSFLGTDRMRALTDRPEVGTLDTDLVAAIIERICNRIDGAVGNQYQVPFAAVTDSTPTPGQIQDLADIGVAWKLYEWLLPSAADAENFRVQFEGKDGDGGMLSRYRMGTEIVIGGVAVAGAQNYRPVAYEAAPPMVSGRIDDDYTDEGVNRSRGL